MQHFTLLNRDTDRKHLGEKNMDQEFQQVVERYSVTLYRLAYSFCQNRQDAEDAVQETFVRYLSTKKVFRDEEHRRNWLMLVTANHCRDLLRSSWRRKRKDLNSLPEQAASTPDPDTHLMIEAALQKLQATDRGIVYLFYFEDYPVKRIAKALGMTETAVRSRLSRARDRLKQILGGELE